MARYLRRELSFSIYPNITAIYEGALKSALSSAGGEDLRVLIDIPIGLPDVGERACDREGRVLLGGRRSTLFPVPVRSAVYAESFSQCGERNLIGQGKRVSIQFWNIAPKVIEVDTFLRDSSEMIGVLYEGHPELAFRRLSGEVIQVSKHSPDGRALRSAVIGNSVDGNHVQAIKEFVGKNKKWCTEGDLLDAASLALLSSTYVAELEFVGDGANDAFALPMRIAA